MRSIRIVSTRRQARLVGGEVGRASFPKLQGATVAQWAEACVHGGLPRRWAPVAAKAAHRAFAREEAKFERDFKSVLDALLSKIASLPDDEQEAVAGLIPGGTS